MFLLTQLHSFWQESSALTASAHAVASTPRFQLHQVIENHVMNCNIYTEVFKDRSKCTHVLCKEYRFKLSMSGHSKRCS